ncbi:small multi-drug export protein [Paenibacillus filicis]|uniref:Small multi-drug export protein n=1 Tax=Paenibacillus filicis TaxID=669464 RepID=A0ABU9DEA4_9BACL
MLVEYLQEWSYLAVFILSALPSLESAVIVVLGVAFGLNPIGVTIAALLGNWLVLMLVVFAFDRFQKWLGKRRGAAKQSVMRERAHRIFVRYGLPGLAVVAPLVIGTEIAAAFAMSFKAPRGPVTFWMTLGMVAWTVVAAVGSYYGFDAIGWIRKDMF